MLSPAIYLYLAVPLLAFEGSAGLAVGHQSHVCYSMAGCAAVMGGGMMVLEKGHVVAWLWLARAENVGAHDEALVYFVAQSQS